MARVKPELTLKEFISYVWSFYGTDQLYCEYFYNDLTLKEVEAACTLRYQNPGFSGDSIDREAVRDILTYARNITVKDNYLSLSSPVLKGPPDPRWSNNPVVMPRHALLGEDENVRE